MVDSMHIGKVVLVGDGGVGKTAIKERYMGKGFSSEYLSTVGADFVLKEMVFKKVKMKLQIWDLVAM